MFPGPHDSQFAESMHDKTNAEKNSEEQQSPMEKPRV